jgi:serine/threonine protein kinase/WD40 repeat protein/tetratricopeptide (TPR) repeat protein
MTSRLPTSALPTSADPAFDLLVDELIARLQAGEPPDWPALAREHPEYVGRLRSMAGALQALGDLSRAGSSALSGVAPLAGAEEAVPGVLGDFRILREVGRGGMGVVYEAEQVSLNRRVALKVLPFAATLDPRQLERFRHEARAAALLHHPHIVPVHGVGCERGVHYYAMQLIEGCSLAAVIQGWRGPAEEGKGPTGEPTGPYVGGGPETRPLAARDTVPHRQAPKPFRRIAELVAQAAEALEYAHTMGVVHRDVKPANLLLDTGGNAWVTDFGLARLGEGPGLTLTGDLLGTLRYMSPEQALARHGLVDHRTDVYSLGATFYELLTLRPAIDRSSKQEILHRLAFEEPVAPRKRDRSIPADLETVALKALAKDPQERYATAQGLADDLRRWLADQPILARPPGPWQRLRRWSRRHRPLVAALGASLLLLVAGLCLGAVAFGLRKAELAEERSRFAKNKEQSERRLASQLRQVLIDRAEAIRLARAPGYRRRVWADLRQALRLRGTGGDRAKVRGTVLACLGDPVGLDPVADPAAVPRRKLPALPARSEQWVRKVAPASPIAVSADAALVAVAGRSGGVAVYRREGKRLRRESSPLGGVYALALAADAKLLVAGCEQGFVTWDLPGPDRWVVRAGNVFSIALSPNRRLLATGGRQLELWSLATKRLLATFPAPAAGARVEFSADGKVLLAVVNGTPVAGWQVSDTPQRRVLDGHTAGVPALAFSPDGRRLASVSKDRTVRLWDAASGRPLRTLTGHAGEIEAVAFHPNGSLLATGDLAGGLRVWDARSGDLLTQAGRDKTPDQVWRLQFGPGGEYLAAAGGNVVAWTLRTAPGRVRLEPLCTLMMRPGNSGVIDLAARPGGSELVYLDREGRLYSYDLARTDTPKLLAKARVGLRSLHFTPSGGRLTFLTPHGTLGVRAWRGKAADTHRRAESVAVSSDGRWAAVAGAGQGITVAELVSGREVFALPPEGGDVWCLAWAPDGSKLAAGLSDGRVAVWDLKQVRARLAEFGFSSSRVARAKAARPLAPVPAFDRVVRVNRLWTAAARAHRRAAAARDVGDHAALRDRLRAALELDKRLAEIAPDAPGHRQRLAWTHATLAHSLARLGNTKAALAHLDAAARLLQRLTRDGPGNPEYRRNRAYELGMRRLVLELAGRRAEAVAAAHRAAAVRKELAADPGTPEDRSHLVVVHHHLAFALFKAGRKAEAERWFNAALAEDDRLAHDQPAAAEDPLLRSDRGATCHYLGVLRHQAGDPAGAVQRFREAAALRARLAGDFPRSVGYVSGAGLTLHWLGVELRDLGQLEESAQRFREAARWQRAALALRPRHSGIRGLCRHHLANLATTLLHLGRHAAAADVALELPPLAFGDPAVLLRAARLLARCVALAERDRGPPGGVGPALARAYRGEALALVRAAVAKGLADATPLLSHPDFDRVRDCDEFRLLQGGLDRKKK